MCPSTGDSMWYALRRDTGGAVVSVARGAWDGGSRGAAHGRRPGTERRARPRHVQSDTRRRPLAVAGRRVCGSDTFDHLIPEDLRQASVVTATMLYNTAMRDELLPWVPLSP